MLSSYMSPIGLMKRSFLPRKCTQDLVSVDILKGPIDLTQVMLPENTLFPVMFNAPQTYILIYLEILC